MQKKDHGQVDRRPWHVEEGERAWSGQELAQREQIAHRCKADLGITLERMQTDDVEHPAAQAFVERPSHPHHYARADEFQKAVKTVEDADQRHQRHQRRHGTAGQNPVIDLQHEKRAGQHQQVDDQAEHASRGKRRPAGAERLADALPAA